MCGLDGCVGRLVVILVFNETVATEVDTSLFVVSVRSVCGT